MDSQTSITVKYYDSNIVSGSSDKFRNAIGMYWIPITTEINNLDNTSLEFPLSQEVYGSFGTLTDKMGVAGAYTANFYNLHNITELSYIDNGFKNDNIGMFEVLSTTKGTVESNSLVTTLKIPIRIVGNTEKFHEDKHWKAFIEGGTFFTSSYPGIFSADTYDVYNYTTQAPYSLLEAKNLLPANHIGLSSYNISSVYKNCYKEYESKARTLMSPLLLPNVYILDSIRQESAAGSSVDLYNIMGAEIMDYACLNLDSGQVVGLMKGVDSKYLPPYAIDQTSLGSYLAQGTDLYFDKTKNLRDFLTGTFVYNSVKPETLNYVTSKFRNMMFTDETIKRHYTGPHMQDNVLDRIPMYVSFSVPRNPGQKISEKILEHDYEDLFLSLLRKEFEQGTEISMHNSVAATTMLKINEIGSRDLITTFAPQQHRSIDFLKMIFKAASTSFEPSSPDQFYLEPTNTPNALHLLNENGAYRYSHTLATLPFLKSIINELNNLPFYQDNPETGASMSTSDMNKLIGTKDFMSLKLWTLAMKEIETTSVTEGAITVDELGDFSSSIFDTESVAELARNTHPASETLAYRIEKIGRETLENGTVSETVIQNVYFTNNNSLGLNLEYFDSQVLPNQTYRYNVYEYKLVKGYKYRYSDIRATRLIANNMLSDSTYSILTDDLSLTPINNVELQNCLEFYDLQTEEAMPALAPLTNSNLAVPLTVTIDTVEAGQNAAATTAQVRSTQRYLADFNIEIEPTYKLIELPYATKELTVLDNPPHSPDVTPYQRMDDSQIIGFYISKDAPTPMAYPTPLNAAEERLKHRYLNSKNITTAEKLKENSISQQRYLEVYRTDKRPNSMTDFASSLVVRKDLKLKDYYATHKNCFFEEKIRTNKKYYYTFRFVNENEIPGKWSPITVVELVNDGGYKYAKFDTIYESSFQVFSDLVTSAPIRKLMRMPPAALQTTFEDSKVDYTKEAHTQYNNLKIGQTQDPLWDRAFKIRLTSKKTGNKIDLNVTYRLKEPFNGSST